MKKLVYLAIILSATFLMSCSVQDATLTYMPKASNTINTVRFDELNLDRNDYTILKDVTAEATFVYQESEDEILIEEQNNEFSVRFGLIDPTSLEPQKNKKDAEKKWLLYDFDGIAYFGYLSNDYGTMSLCMDPEWYARHFAFYRLINQCKAVGGDALIEPIVSTNVMQQGNTLVFTTTASAKVVKINTNK